MIKRGYLPVGGDFPVFLHPRSHEEYALARTERKTAPGYHGFIFHASPDVTLEEDLARRDLTINAMALAPDGFIIDPFGGQHDLAAGILRPLLKIPFVSCASPALLRACRLSPSLLKRWH